MRFLILLVALVAGCSTLPPECKTEYGYTLSHCPARPKTRRPVNAAECEQAGGVSIMKNHRYQDCVSHDALWRILRGHAG